jgi:hypothetical protein
MAGFPGGFDPSAVGARLADDGPGAILDEIENLIPQEYREQIQAFPLVAVALGVGVGVWLGMKKSDEIISAGGALLSSAAMANVTQVMEKMKG